MAQVPERRRGAAPAAQAGGLAAWAEGAGHRQGRRNACGGWRFAFYGRVSTEDWQDPVTSRARQLQQAGMLIAGRGVITAEFFDTGASRVLPWARRPQAAALVAQLADPDRGWEAVVIGEYERAFYGNQYALMARYLSITASRSGCRRWAGEWTGTLKTTRRPCSRWACRRSGRLPGRGSGSAPRWLPRPWSRAVTWAGARRTGTSLVMPGRTRTRPTPRGGAGRTGWSRTRKQRTSCGGCSRSGWPGAAPRGSPVL